jgi:hypothetical protein
MIAFLLLSLCFLPTIFGHAMWAVPAPRVQNSGLKSVCIPFLKLKTNSLLFTSSHDLHNQYPCGDYQFWGTGQPTTTLSPGPMLVTWQETIWHDGAPFRIALSYGDDSHYDDLILWDHIPHNNINGKNYTVNITIPDINW